MDIEKIVSDTKIKYISGQECGFINLTEILHIFDTTNKIYFITSGFCKFVFEEPEAPYNFTHTQQAGEMMIIPAGVRHSIYSEPDPEGRELWVSFQFEIAGKNIFSLFDFPLVIKPADPKKAEKLMLKAIEQGSRSSLYATYRQNAAIIELVMYFLEESGAQLKDSKIYNVESIIQYIDNNLSHNFTLEELAEMAHLHPTHFIRQFKKLTGTTPIKYITAKRMYYAWAKLAHTSMSVAEIMTHIGYSDHAHFSRTFKKYYEISPRQYRKEMTGQMGVKTQIDEAD